MCKYIVAFSILNVLGSVCGKAEPYSVQLADLKQDVSIMQQRQSGVELDLENLQRQNRELGALIQKLQAQTDQLKGQNQQLQMAVTALKTGVQEGHSRLQTTILSELESQTAEMRRAFEANVPKPQNTSAKTEKYPLGPEFANDYPKTGIEYVVKKGDTLYVIALKHNSTSRDIQNANRIVNPKELKVGQTIFVPQKEQR